MFIKFSRRHSYHPKFRREVPQWRWLTMSTVQHIEKHFMATETVRDEVIGMYMAR
jgi:hypothetical protein